MAGVKSVTVYSERPWRDGLVRRRYEVTLTDNFLVDEVIVTMPVNVLPSDDGTALASRILANKEASEEAGIEGAEDPLSYTLNPRWSAVKPVAKYAIRWMMREKDPYIVLQLKPLLEYIQANYNATQVANLLDITPTQVSKMNARINTVLDATVESALLSYDLNGEEIE